MPARGPGLMSRTSNRCRYEGVFDICVIYDCLHHAGREQAVLEGVFRALRAGGEVIVVEPGRGHHQSATSRWAATTHGVSEKDMSPRLTARLLRGAGFTVTGIFPRLQFQMVEKVGTGRIVGVLRPLVGSRIAALVKTIKNSILIKSNGIVLAKKPPNTPAEGVALQEKNQDHTPISPPLRLSV